MKIKDLIGQSIAVTNLACAIEQADLYKGYRNPDPASEQSAADDQRQAYWTDIHGKLLQLQSDSKLKNQTKNKTNGNQLL